MYESLAVRGVQMIQHMMAAIGNHMQIDLMAMIEVGRIGRLVGKIQVQLMTAKPGKGQDLLT